MLSINDLRLGTVITLNNQPYEVTFAQHLKMARSGARLRAKLKNLIDGSVIERNFSAGDKIEAAEITRRKAHFLYAERDMHLFMDNETFDQYEIPNDAVDARSKFLKDGQPIDALLFNGRAVNIDLPKKVTLRVESTPPGVKGDTTGSATKTAVLETGLEIKVPLFIKNGDYIRVNTDTGEYVERTQQE